MCGIVGMLHDPRDVDFSEATLRLMTARLNHRGPDDGGGWIDRECGVFLGHRRLSILDLTEAGHQPMISRSGRRVLIFNGEIYNHAELRQCLGWGQWRGHSDTETLLTCIEAWGLEATLQRCVGMYAFALWDMDARELVLVRDRCGEKPLYYGWVRGAFVFASELKAIRSVPGFDNPIDRKALALFMRHNCVPSPWSIYEKIWKLPPAAYVKFSSRKMQPGERGQVRAYWSATEMAMQGWKNPFSGNDAEALETLERLLEQGIAGQMIADVPLGAFLSGGVDSSTVVAIMQSLSSRPVRTFTIGFHESGYDEAKHAQAVARHLGTEHTELYVSPSEALDVIPRIPEIYDEPFADSSQIPTFLIAKLARAHVTVALSGDGGDELFGGYNRYLWAQRLWRSGMWLPASVRRLCSKGLTAIPPHGWDRFCATLEPLFPRRFRYGNLGDKIHKLAGILGASDPRDFYLRCVSHWDAPALVIGAEEPLNRVTGHAADPEWPDNVLRMMYLDLITYLPDDILTKLDRAAMAVSLETRVPLLDHRCVEFAWRLPLSMKIRNGQGKWALRQVLYKHVPKELIERPKAGFAVPLDSWLRGPLRAWAEDLLDESRLRREGYFNPTPIRRAWAEHLSGRFNHQYHVWDVLMFQAWLDQWR